MAKHFTAANITNGYAAIGNSLKRPRYKSVGKRDVRTAIEAERMRAARAARISGGGKKK